MDVHQPEQHFLIQKEKEQDLINKEKTILS